MGRDPRLDAERRGAALGRAVPHHPRLPVQELRDRVAAGSTSLLRPALTERDDADREDRAIDRRHWHVALGHQLTDQRGGLRPHDR